MRPARAVEPGFSPLDERLELLPGSRLTPRLSAGIVRLGAHLPFAQVPPLVAHFTGVTVSAATVRRLTEAAGAIQVARETAAVAAIERDLPVPPAGPPLQQLSVDGAFVPLLGGVWAEVKTLCLGRIIQQPAGGADAAEPAPPRARTVDLSYFSRLTDSDTFGRLATVETQQRGTETATTVVAIVDGADWCQGFIDLHRPDAVRILDFPHAVGYLSAVAHVVHGAGSAAATDWLEQQARALRQGQAATVIATLAQLLAAPVGAEAHEVVRIAHGYLDTRRDQLQYQAFTAAGYPIASGCVESANKLVVEARLKGSGMHWAREHVNPMLALRTVHANQRWDATWPMLWSQWRCQARQIALQRRKARRPPAPVQLPSAPASAPVRAVPPLPRPTPLAAGAHTPASDHPWRRSSRFTAKQ
jgi:hypothetical protein